MNTFEFLALPEDIDFQKIQLFIEKLLFLTGSLLYLVFAVVVVRQINIMEKTIMTDFSPVITLLGLMHLAFTISVFIGFLIFL